jgi:hypothetical protein
LPAVRGLLGLESHGLGNAPDGSLQVSFAPNLPADWPSLRFQRYAIADGNLSGEVLQQRGRTTLHLAFEGNSPLLVMLAPALPAAARITGALLDGKPQKFSVRDSGSFLRVELAPVALRSPQQLTLTVDYQGGIGIVPSLPRPQPGERTSSLKILDVQSDPQNRSCLLRLTLAGIGGRTYPLQVVTSLSKLQAAGLPVRKTEIGYEIEIPFEGSSYVTRRVCLSE